MYPNEIEHAVRSDYPLLTQSGFGPPTSRYMALHNNTNPRVWKEGKLYEKTTAKRIFSYTFGFRINIDVSMKYVDIKQRWA